MSLNNKKEVKIAISFASDRDPAPTLENLGLVDSIPRTVILGEYRCIINTDKTRVNLHVLYPFNSETRDTRGNSRMLNNSEFIFIVFDATDPSSFAKVKQNLDGIQEIVDSMNEYELLLNPIYCLVGVFDSAKKHQKVFVDEIEQKAKSLNMHYCAEISNNGFDTKKLILAIYDAECEYLHQIRCYQTTQSQRAIAMATIQVPITIRSRLTALFQWFWNLVCSLFDNSSQMPETIEYASLVPPQRSLLLHPHLQLTPPPEPEAGQTSELDAEFGGGPGQTEYSIFQKSGAK